MRELIVVAGILVGMVVIAAAFYVPWTLTYNLGLGVTVIGAVIGVPTGTLYHIQLYRALRSRNQLPSDWYWQPIPLNERLTPRERTWVLPWCYVGGVGFMLMVVGLVLLT